MQFSKRIYTTCVFSGACTIETEDKVILSGGVLEGGESSIVSIYDEDGWLRDLPNLQSARKDHGCGHYFDERDNLVNNL